MLHKPDANDVVLIGICTFRRAELEQTLASLRNLLPCGLPVAIAIADNDAEPTARPLVERVSRDHPLPMDYLHAPSANISIARNALLDHAVRTGARALIYLDDDQTVQPEWLQKLVAAWTREGAGVVLGPVRATYLQGAPVWMTRGRPHDTQPVTGAEQQIISGYTGNSLIDMRDPSVHGLRFDLSRGRTGGEDTAWFAQYLSAGGRIAYAPDAIVDETVPADRASLRWLLKRRYRMGHTHASILVEGRGQQARLKAAAVAAAKTFACCGMALLSAASPARRNRQLMRAALHAGATAHLGGARQVELYGNTSGLPRGSKGT